MVGPATNYKFKRMLPMHVFLDKIMDNTRAWLRIYEPEDEARRIQELKELKYQGVAKGQT